VIIWQLDLQLPVQSVHITSKVVISNPVHCDVYSVLHYVATGWGFSPCTSVSSTNKADDHDIAEE